MIKKKLHQFLFFSIFSLGVKSKITLVIMVEKKINKLTIYVNKSVSLCQTWK